MNQNEPNRQPVTALCVQHSERSPILIADELDDGDAVAALVEFAAVRFFDQGMASQFVTHDAAQDTGALAVDDARPGQRGQESIVQVFFQE